jgi:V/A-type H+-transporting ATPase subunit A
VDNAVSVERQKHIFDIVFRILSAEFDFQIKDEARQYFNRMRQLFLDYNGARWNTDEFAAKEREIVDLLSSKQKGLDENAAG